MNSQLSLEDRQALDLLLDRAVTAGKKGTAVYAAASTGVRERLPHVQQVLHLLDALPAADVPADLASRTIDFIHSPKGQRKAARAVRELTPVLADQPSVA